MNEKNIWQFCVAGVAVGMAVLFYGLYVWVNAETQAKWPVAQGKILSSQVISKRTYDSSESIGYRQTSVVEFSYVVSGQSFRASQRSNSRSLSTKYPTGTTAPVHYDPNDPSSSILEPPLFEGRAFAWVGFVFCIGIPIAATVLSKQIRSGNQTGLGNLVQDPKDLSEVLAWKRKNGMTA